MIERLGSRGTSYLLALLLHSTAAFGQTPPTDNSPASQPSNADENQALAQPNPQRVQPPRLLTFVDAVYPPAAAQAQVTAKVRLILHVKADGSVESATVQLVDHERSPAKGRETGSEEDAAEATFDSGANDPFGFGQPALEAARNFQFEPAQVDGKPVAVKIPFTYSFTLAPAAVEEPPALEDGDLVVRVQSTDEQAPLEGAEVRISTPDGQVIPVTRDLDGAWRTLALDPGRYLIEAVSSGYDLVSTFEEVVAGKSTDVVYRLTPELNGAVEVLVLGTRPAREVTRRVISRREMTRIPGTSGDALRSIQSLPGVARPPGLAGLLIIRGSSPQDTSVFVNGDEVPLIYHFGGLTSAVPSELLESIDFYPGNFSSRYGRAMGGVVDVQLRAPDTQCTDKQGAPADSQGCYHGMAQVDLLDTRFVLQGPLPLEGWSFAAGGRRSWLDAWLGPVLREAGSTVTTAPVYSDYQIIAERSPSPNEKLSFRFFGSNDALEVLVENPSSQDPGVLGGNIRFATGFWRAQAVLATQLSQDVALNALLSVGQDSVDFSFGRFFLTLKSYPIQTRSEFTWKVGKAVKLSAGLDFQFVPFDSVIRLPEPPRPGETSAGPFTTRPLLESKSDSAFFRPAWYMDAQLTPIPHLTVTPGVRVDYARDTGQSDFSPRLSARYNLSTYSEQPDGTLSRRTTLKGGVGIFHQPAQPQETNEVFGTPGLETNRALHASLGIEREFTDEIELSVEGFYKNLDHLVSRRPGATGSFVYANEGTGDVLGAELLLKFKPDEKFFGWVAYTLSRSRRRDNPELPLRPFQFDQTHILTILGSYRLGRGWEAGARFRLVSGALDTPVAQYPSLSAVYSADAATYTPLEGRPFSARLPTFHQLDLRIEKTWQFDGLRLMTFLDVLNSYNHAAREALLYNFNFSRKSYQQGLPLVPSLGLRGEF